MDSLASYLAGILESDRKKALTLMKLEDKEEAMAQKIKEIISSREKLAAEKRKKEEEDAFVLIEQ